MNLKQLQKAQKLYDRIKELDAEIIEVEKVAQYLADKKTSVKFSVKVTDIEKIKEKDKVSLDADGSLIYGQRSPMDTYKFMFSPFGLPSCTPEKKEAPDASYKCDISDSVCLGVLGVVLASKMEARELAMKALNKIGITV
jgi:hypothetical protein